MFNCLGLHESPLGLHERVLLLGHNCQFLRGEGQRSISVLLFLLVDVALEFFARVQLSDL